MTRETIREDYDPQQPYAVPGELLNKYGRFINATAYGGHGGVGGHSEGGHASAQIPPAELIWGFAVVTDDANTCVSEGIDGLDENGLPVNTLKDAPCRDEDLYKIQFHAFDVDQDKWVQVTEGTEARLDCSFYRESEIFNPIVDGGPPLLEKDDVLSAIWHPQRAWFMPIFSPFQQRTYCATLEEFIEAGGTGMADGEEGEVELSLTCAHGNDGLTRGTEVIYVRRKKDRLIIHAECPPTAAAAASQDANCPKQVILPDPNDREDQVSQDVTICWTSDGDKFDVYFGKPGALVLVLNDTTDTCFTPGTLEANTEYAWLVVAKKDNSDCEKVSGYFRFDTGPDPAVSSSSSTVGQSTTSSSSTSTAAADYSSASTSSTVSSSTISTSSTQSPSTASSSTLSTSSTLSSSTLSTSSTASSQSSSSSASTVSSSTISASSLSTTSQVDDYSTSSYSSSSSYSSKSSSSYSTTSQAFTSSTISSSKSSSSSYSTASSSSYSSLSESTQSTASSASTLSSSCSSAGGPTFRQSDISQADDVTQMQMSYPVDVQAGSALYVVVSAWNNSDTYPATPSLDISDTMGNTWSSSVSAANGSRGHVLRIYRTVANSTGANTVTVTADNSPGPGPEESTSSYLSPGQYSESSLSSYSSDPSRPSWMAMFISEVPNWDGSQTEATASGSGADTDAHAGAYNPGTSSDFLYLAAYSHDGVATSTTQGITITEDGDWNLELEIEGHRFGLPLSVIWKESQGSQNPGWTISHPQDYLAVGAAYRPRP